VIYLRNCNAARALLVRTAPDNLRVVLPSETTSLAVPRAVLADPEIQRRLARARAAVLDHGAWCADLRQRRAAQLSWQELIAEAERAELDRLRQVRPEPDRRVLRSTKPRKRRDDEWHAEHVARLKQLAAAGLTYAAIARQLDRSVGAVGAQARRLDLPRRCRQPDAQRPGAAMPVPYRRAGSPRSSST
jgi:hypothetical protein